MAKPIGPICNLDCKYCFYLEKKGLYAKNERFRMSDEVLEAYVKQYIEGQDVPEISFVWQGGEPTLLGVDFFRKVVALQRTYASGKRISNAIQTNGTLLDDEWCAFLTEHQFLVGISIDGPAHLHDVYRVDKRQKPTIHDVMRGVEFLKKHKTEFNTLTVVNRKNSYEPLVVYRFLREIGSGYMQFIPLVERKADDAAKALGLDLAVPPDPEGDADPGSPVTSWSVKPNQYGTFLIEIFEEWVRQDVGKYFVQMFDVALGNWLGTPPSLCVFSPTCGSAMALEHDGNLYSCDHYVYSKYNLGNILNTTIVEMVNSAQQRKFGTDKLEVLPRVRRAVSLSRRVPQAPVHQDAGRRARAQLPVSGLQEILPPRGSLHAGDGPPSPPGPASRPDHGHGSAARSAAGLGKRQAQRRLFVREWKKVQGVLHEEGARMRAREDEPCRDFVVTLVG
jgi:uncharacterized protein